MLARSSWINITGFFRTIMNDCHRLFITDVFSLPEFAASRSTNLNWNLFTFSVRSIFDIFSFL